MNLSRCRWISPARSRNRHLRRAPPIVRLLLGLMTSRPILSSTRSWTNMPHLHFRLRAWRSPPTTLQTLRPPQLPRTSSLWISSSPECRRPHRSMFRPSLSLTRHPAPRLRACRRIKILTKNRILHHRTRTCPWGRLASERHQSTGPAFPSTPMRPPTPARKPPHTRASTTIPILRGSRHHHHPATFPRSTSLGHFPAWAMLEAMTCTISTA